MVTVKDSRNVEFTTLYRNLCDVGDAFSEWFVCLEVTLQKVIRLSGFPVGLGYAVRLMLFLVFKPHFSHDTIDGRNARQITIGMTEHKCLKDALFAVVVGSV